MNDKTKAMLLLDGGSLHYQVELKPMEAIEFASAIKDDDLENMIKEINDILPTMYYYEGNVNNNKMNHVFWIGRECSRVVYIYMPSAYLRKNINVVELKSKIADIAKKYLADEIHDQSKNSGIHTRIWWD